MCQQWLSVAGLVLDVIGFLIIAFEWRHTYLHSVFLREAQVTGQLEHPGVVPVHELGVDEAGQPFYSMKFIKGRTLTEVIADYHANAVVVVDLPNWKVKGVLPLPCGPTDLVVTMMWA